MPQATAKLNAFPVFMRVEGEAVAIVGGGEEALAKARLIGQSSAVLRIIADAAEAELLAFIAANGAIHIAAAYDAAHLEGAVMAFAASGNEALDRRVAEDARRMGIPVNAVDRPELCDFFTPALVNRAPVAIAIGTEGAGPVLAQMLRSRIDRMLSPSLGPLASLAASLRGTAERLLPKGNARRRFWSDFFGGAPARAMAAGQLSQAHDAAVDLLLSNAPASGHIALVGAGPGAEDLLTLRAHRLLMEADVIVHDALVPETIVAMGRRDAERLPVGKRKGCHTKSQAEINALLIELGRDGKRVVRLKSGDPLVFGRAGE
ncbi:SAM-dependent methyltransferase, partial [Mesorhizobium sp.]